MANFGAADVPALLRDLGVDITLGANTVKGLVDRADGRVLQGDGGMAAVIGRDVLVTLQTGSLAGLVVGASITVDGVSYKVASLLAVEDGELTQVICRKP